MGEEGTQFVRWGPHPLHGFHTGTPCERGAVGSLVKNSLLVAPMKIPQLRKIEMEVGELKGEQKT